MTYDLRTPDGINYVNSFDFDNDRIFNKKVKP